MRKIGRHRKNVFCLALTHVDIGKPVTAVSICGHRSLSFPKLGTSHFFLGKLRGGIVKFQIAFQIMKIAPFLFKIAAASACFAL